MDGRQECDGGVVCVYAHVCVCAVCTRVCLHVECRSGCVSVCMCNSGRKWYMHTYKQQIQLLHSLEHRPVCGITGTEPSLLGSCSGVPYNHALWVIWVTSTKRDNVTAQRRVKETGHKVANTSDTQWNLSIKGTLNKEHLSNEDTACSPKHIELCTNLPLN